MKKHTRLKIASMLLAISISVNMLPYFTVFAEDAQHEELPSRQQLWIPEERIQQNTEGDLPIEKLKTAVLSNDDKPEVISDSLIAEKGHVNRLWAQEEDLNSIIFQNRDGKKTMYCFEQPVKYVDSSGKIRDKKNFLSSVIDKPEYTEDYGYVNSENDIKTYFPKNLSQDNGVILEYENNKIEVSPIAAMKKFAIGPELSLYSSTKHVVRASVSSAAKKQYQKQNNISQDTIEYDKVFGDNTYLRYSTTFNGFKEDIILTQNTGVNEFSFKIKTGGLSLTQDEGIYYLTNPLTGENIIQIGNIVVYDSKSVSTTKNFESIGNEAPNESIKPELPDLTEEEKNALYFPKGSTETIYNHHYTVHKVDQDNEYIITIVIDEKYLNNEDTVYPVTIDPSFIIKTSFSQDATIYSNYAVNEGYAANMFVGNYTNRNGGTRGVARSLVKFPGLFSNNTFNSLSASRIYKVLYIPRDTMCEIDGVWIDCYRVTQNWSEGDVKCNRSIWNAYGGPVLDDNYVYYNNGTGSEGTGTGHWYPFDITDAVKDWKNGYYGGTSNHYGIMLKAYDETKAAKTFGTNNNSTLGPNIIVEYDPAVTGIGLSSSCKEVNVGWSGYVSATVYPTSAPNKTVYWTSSNPNVAKVNYYSGLICASGVGTTVITATTADGGFTARCTVDVEEIPWSPLSTSLVSNIGGPPRSFPDGTPITADNKQDYYNGERYTAVYFLDTVWPIQTAVWDKQGLATHLRTPWYTVYTVWAQETYGLNWLEQFWHNADAFLLGVSDAAVSTLEGAWVLISNPGQVIDGMGLILNAVLSDGVERELLNQLISDTIDQCWADFTGSSETRSRLIGRIVGEVLIDYIAAKGITKAISEFKNTKIFSKIQTLIAKGRISGEDAAQVLSRYGNFSSQMKKKIDTLLDRATAARNQVEPLYATTKNSGNVGVALTQIQGVPAELKAYSKITTASDVGSDLGYILKKSNPQFTPLETWRLTDTESKILEEVASKLGNNTSATGAIQLFTERAPCASCKSVIAQFRQRYPNINLTVFDANLNSY